LPFCVQFFNATIGVLQQERVCPGQRVNQLFNLAFDFGKLGAGGGELWIIAFRLAAPRRLKFPHLFYHFIIDRFFQLVPGQRSGPRTAFVFYALSASHVRHPICGVQTY
jgi:hypothetical protein